MPRPRAGFLISIFFNHVVRQLCRLHSQETMWVRSCCRRLFWLCSLVDNVHHPCPVVQRGGKASAGSRLGKGFGSSKGFASPAACLDGSRNTGLKENHLPDSLEKVSFQLLGKTVRGQEFRQKKGCCSFCYVLALRLLLCGTAFVCIPTAGENPLPVHVLWVGKRVLKRLLPFPYSKHRG